MNEYSPSGSLVLCSVGWFVGRPAEMRWNATLEPRPRCVVYFYYFFFFLFSFFSPFNGLGRVAFEKRGCVQLAQRLVLCA